MSFSSFLEDFCLSFSKMSSCWRLKLQEGFDRTRSFSNDENIIVCLVPSLPNPLFCKAASAPNPKYINNDQMQRSENGKNWEIKHFCKKILKIFLNVKKSQNLGIFKNLHKVFEVPKKILKICSKNLKNSRFRYPGYQSQKMIKRKK